jgi:hypothetical protein
MFIENCNIRDLSDTAKCMVGHPDHIMPNGLMQYTYMTSGELKKLFPTCTQPSSKQVAAAQAFQKKQQDLYNANIQKANDQLNAATQPITYGQPQKPRLPRSAQQTAASPQDDYLPLAWATRSSAPLGRCSPRSFPAPTNSPLLGRTWRVFSRVPVIGV